MKKKPEHAHRWLLVDPPQYQRSFAAGLSIRVLLRFVCVGDDNRQCGAQCEFIIDDTEARPWTEKGFLTHFRTLPGSGQQMEVAP